MSTMIGIAQNRVDEPVYQAHRQAMGRHPQHTVAVAVDAGLSEQAVQA